MAFLRAVDLRLLRVITAAAHALQRALGLTSFRLLVHVHIVLVLFDLLHSMDYWWPSWLPHHDVDLTDVWVSGALIAFRALTIVLRIIYLTQVLVP